METQKQIMVKPVMGKKGQALGGLRELAMAFVTAGAVVGIGALFLGELAADPSVSGSNNSTTIVQDAQEGVINLTNRFALIGTIAGLTVVLGLVLRATVFK